MPNNSKKVLITGGAGFLGYFITKELLKRGCEVVIYDAFLNFIPKEQSTYPLYLKERLKDIHAENRIHIVRGDVRDTNYLKKTIQNEKPEVVIHLVAIPIASASTQFFDEAVQINLVGTLSVLQAIKESRVDVKRFVYTSSSFVYGDFVYEPADEKHPTNTIDDIYGVTKLSGEFLTRSYGRKFGLEYVIIRPSAVYGPTDTNRRVTQIFIENAFKNKPLILHGGGETKLDFTYVKDTAQGFALAALSPRAKNETFNITRGEGRSIAEFVAILQELIPGIRTIVKPADERRPERGALDISKARELLGYNPQYSLEDGLREYVKYVSSTGVVQNI